MFVPYGSLQFSVDILDNWDHIFVVSYIVSLAAVPIVPYENIT